MELVVDNTRILRDATFDRETRAKLVEASDLLRTLAAICGDVTDLDRGGCSLTGLGVRIANHVRGIDAWEVRDAAQCVDEVGERWDANDKTQIRLLPDGTWEDDPA